MILYSADWVLPITAPIIKNGAIAVRDGRIVEVGPQNLVLQKYAGAPEQNCHGVLMPGLVNAHIHLELSYLHPVKSLEGDISFPGWIEALLEKRSSESVGQDEIDKAIDRGIAAQYQAGVILIANVGNVFPLPALAKRIEQTPEIINMVEFLAPTKEALTNAQERLVTLPHDTPACVHAPYSCSRALYQEVKKRCTSRGHVFSTHVAESKDEIIFLASGTGAFRSFLEKRNCWDGTFPFEQQGVQGSINYLHGLGVLDRLSLLVHVVHAEEQELLRVKKSGAHICLCPGSNQFLQVGLAPLEKMINAGIVPALGTDSSASNPEMDMWHEMQLLAAQHPTVSPATILSMATIAGATALHREGEFGSFEIHKKAKFINILPTPNLLNCMGGDQIERTLVTGGEPKEIKWIGV